MRRILLLLAALGALLPARARAQAQAAPGANTVLRLDTILRLDGEEIRGRVVALGPEQLRYLPAAPAPPDTLALPVAEVFLVRYANGTRAVLRPGLAAAGAPTDLLPGLDARQRDSLGRRDAATHYDRHGPYWGTLGATLYAGPLFGLVAPAVISGVDVKAHNFQAPEPHLLGDADYRRGYQQQANRTKRRRTWGGYGTGVGVWAVLIAALVASVSN